MKHSLEVGGFEPMLPLTCAGGCISTVFSTGKKPLASATFDILIFKYSKPSPFCSVFPPLPFGTCNNEEL